MTFPGYTQQTVPSPQFENAYGDHPWANITTTQRMWYDPILIQLYQGRSYYAPFVRYIKNLGAVNARQMTITSQFPAHANFDQLGLREMWSDTMYADWMSQTITFNRYGAKMAFHRYDTIVNYLTSMNSYAAMRQLSNTMLGQSMVTIFDMLARNAMLQMPFPVYAAGNSFAGLTNNSAKISTAMMDETYLQLQYRKSLIPMMQTPAALDSEYGSSTYVVLTTPGVIYDLQQQTDPRAWLVPNAYASATRLLTNEVGMYRNFRYVAAPNNVLWNSGVISAQVPVTSPINEGDGAPSTKVDGVFLVGQPGATHYIQLGATDASGATVDATYMNAKFKVNDILTIHTRRTGDFGITNGVDYREGKLHNRRIVAIDAANRRISFDMPIMTAMNTEVTTGVYAYVTSGVHVHVSMIMGGTDGVVIGVGEAPRVHVMPPVDDYESMYRTSWDAYVGYQVFNPFAITPVFTYGTVSVVGAAIQG